MRFTKNFPQSLRTLLVGTALLGFIGTASAFPTKPITLIVPFAAGGTQDVTGRLVAELLQKSTGTIVIIENKPGAGGLLGAQMAAKAKPDGHTLLLGADSLIIQPLLRKSVTTTVDDFIPLVRVRTTGNYFGISSSVPARNVQEFVNLAKVSPEKMRYATGGAGSVLHIAGEAFAKAAGISLSHVPYKGAAPAVTDVSGGHVEMAIAGTADFEAHVKNGNIKVIAQSGTKRSLAMPDVPTFTELGYPSVVVVNWTGVLAPKGTPPAVVEWLTEKIAAVANSPEFLSRGRPLAVEPGAVLQGKEFMASLRSAQKHYKEIIENSNINLAD